VFYEYFYRVHTLLQSGMWPYWPVRVTGRKHGLDAPVASLRAASYEPHQALTRQTCRALLADRSV